jgi:uncharacterized SAM-binding protein YcdF (DUF218 family)
MIKKFQGEQLKKNNHILLAIKNRWIRRLLLIFSPIFLMGFYISLRIGFALIQSPQPQIFLILGGSPDREEFTAKFSRQHPLDIWVSSGSRDSEKIFREAGLPKSRIYLDCRATDTVTNFTTVVEDLRSRNIHHVYVVTSEYHMARSVAIATIVFGSQGITFTPLPSPTNRQYPELNAESRIFRDIFRSISWIFTGNALDDLNGRKKTDFCKNPGYQMGIKDPLK